MEFHELSNRMFGCAIAVHWHLGPERKDGIERFFLGGLHARRVVRVVRGTPIAATRLSAMGTFRDRGEQLGPPERANDSVFELKCDVRLPGDLGRWRETEPQRGAPKGMPMARTATLGSVALSGLAGLGGPSFPRRRSSAAPRRPALSDAARSAISAAVGGAHPSVGPAHRQTRLARFLHLAILHLVFE